jgi:hypothetical protein
MNSSFGDIWHIYETLTYRQQIKLETIDDIYLQMDKFGKIDFSKTISSNLDEMDELD